MNKMFKLGSIAAALVVSGMLVGCGSSSSGGDNKTNGNNTNPTPVDPRQCTYSTTNPLVVNKDANFTKSNISITAKDGAKKDITSTIALANVADVNTSKLGNYNVVASSPSCDNKLTIQVQVKAQSTGGGSGGINVPGVNLPVID